MNQSCVYVGVDAGGTRARILYRTYDKREERHLEAPGVNPQVQGPEETARNIARWIEQVQAQTTLPICGLCIGLAGARSEQLKSRILSQLHQTYPRLASIPIRLLDDALLSLEAAFPDASGILLIAGTGSSIIARSIDGQTYRSGGWGYLLGDEGGGYRLGLAGLQAIAAMLDGGPATRLYQTFATHYAPPTRDALIDFVYHQKQPLAQLAPLVLDTAAAGDACARQIVEEQIHHFLLRLTWLWQRIRTTTRAAIALWGGLLQHPYYSEMLHRLIADRLPELNILPMRKKPVARAVELAEQLT